MGKLNLDKAAVESYILEMYNRDNTIEKVEELLELGQRCLEAKADSPALNAYRIAYHCINALKCSTEKKLESQIG